MRIAPQEVYIAFVVTVHKDMELGEEVEFSESFENYQFALQSYNKYVKKYKDVFITLELEIEQDDDLEQIRLADNYDFDIANAQFSKRMGTEVNEEFMTVGDYAKVYDFLNMEKQEFLDFYAYINEKSYDLSMEVAMQPDYMADLMRQAENLLIEEQHEDEENITHMQEVGTDYISADMWKTAIANFVEKHYNTLKKQEFEDLCDSMAC